MSPASKPKKARSGLLTLNEVGERTGISYSTLVHYVNEYEDRIPFEGKGPRRRYHPEAVALFKKLRANRGNWPEDEDRGQVPKTATKKTGRSKKGDRSLARRLRSLEKSQEKLDTEIKDMLSELNKPVRASLDLKTGGTQGSEELRPDISDHLWDETEAAPSSAVESYLGTFRYRTISEADLRSTVARIAESLGPRAWLLESLELPILSIQTPFQQRPENLLTAIDNASESDLRLALPLPRLWEAQESSHLVFLALYPSGTIGSLDATLAPEGLMISNSLSLLDPNFEEGEESTTDVALVGLACPVT